MCEYTPEIQDLIDKDKAVSDAVAAFNKHQAVAVTIQHGVPVFRLQIADQEVPVLLNYDEAQCVRDRLDKLIPRCWPDLDHCEGQEWDMGGGYTATLVVNEEDITFRYAIERNGDHYLLPYLSDIGLAWEWAKQYAAQLIKQDGWPKNKGKDEQ